MFQCAMKQKYQAFQLLQRFFACSEADLELIRIKNIGSKKYVFSPGDQINSIYFVMTGDVNLSFQNKDILVPPQNIIGDFEISKQLSRRTSSFKAHTKAKIIVLPKDFYYKIKPQVEQKEKFLTKHLASENARLNYLMSRCFINKNLVRGEWALSLNNQDDGDVVVIKSGIFSVRKYIGFGVIKKHKIELEKQFALINVGQGQFLKQNIHCDSPKGQIYVCKKQYATILACHFPSFSNILELKSGQMKQSHLQRERSIKKICIPDCELYQSVLPSVFHSERRRSNDKIQHVKTEPIESTGRSQFQKNHYQIKREKNNILTSQQTNSNLSLVPLIRIRKPSMPDKIKLPRTKVLQKYFRSRIEKGFKQKQTSPETKTNGQFQIPEEFCNKFEKKMFLKPTNPFHHHKSRSVSLDEEIKDMKQFKSLKIQENILGKSSSNSKQKKSFLLFSGSPL